MNPLVAPHLDFVREETHGVNIYKSSQSEKWLKHLQPDLRVQMVPYNNKHYYIFEPVKTITSEIVVPIFFYSQDNHLFAKCSTPLFKSNKDNSVIEIGIPQDILFDDKELKIMPIEELDLIYEDIQMNNSLKLSECCRGKMSGENFDQSNIKTQIYLY
jgi:hypothetical protein